MPGAKDYVSIAYEVYHQKQFAISCLALSKNSTQHSGIKMKVLKLAYFTFARD